nr:hypothetical protein [uncultured Allomuricauda sp.]
MRFKIKNITLFLFLINAILLIINIEYQDQIASIIPDLDYAKLCFYLGTLGFITYLKLARSKQVLDIAIVITVISLILALFFNLHLAKSNYDDCLFPFISC